MMATIRNGFLWTCQTVGLSGTNGTYTGNESGTNVDRSAIQWLKLKISEDGTSLSVNDHGRAFDPVQTNAWWYYFRSLAVNCAGDMVMGFSGSSETDCIGALYTWRLANNSIIVQPRLIQPGITNYADLRWGDYSETTLDPVDDWSFWTVQEYSAPSGVTSVPWRTVISKLRLNP
jgi:hypothetical protein